MRLSGPEAGKPQWLLFTAASHVPQNADQEPACLLAVTAVTPTPPPDHRQRAEGQGRLGTLQPPADLRFSCPSSTQKGGTHALPATRTLGTDDSASGCRRVTPPLGRPGANIPAWSFLDDFVVTTSPLPATSETCQHCVFSLRSWVTREGLQKTLDIRVSLRPKTFFTVDPAGVFGAGGGALLSTHHVTDQQTDLRRWEPWPALP